MRAKPGRILEKEKLKTYPPGQACTVQENGWMDRQVLVKYAQELLKCEIDSHSVLLLDNFDCHISEERQRVVTDETSATVCTLPANSTALCQPLDIGVMGPLNFFF